MPFLYTLVFEHFFHQHFQMASDCFLGQNKYLGHSIQGFQGHSLVFDVSRTFHRFCESNVKRPQRFAHARNAREPLFTGTFWIDCEGESIFLIFVL